VVPPPHKLPKTGSGRANRDRNQASQRAGPPGPDELASGDPRGPEINISPGTSVPPAPPVDTHHPASPVEAPMPSQQGRQVLNAASDRETADGQEAVIERTNPSRGPTTGGPEIWISGSNFPAGLLYARFGDNFAHAVGVVSPSFGKHLISSRSFKNPTCSLAVCRELVFRVQLQWLSPAFPSTTPLFLVQVFVNSSTSRTMTSCESRQHPLQPPLTSGV